MSSREVWSVSFGRWRGVHVHLHMFFFLFAVFNYYLLWFSQRTLGSQVTAEHDVISILFVAILFVSVLLHELGHLFVAKRLGGNVDSIVIGPLGGMRPIRIPHDPQSELLTVIAGPMTSLAVCLVCLTAFAAVGFTDLASLINPLVVPSVIFESFEAKKVLSWSMVIGLTCWINWLLVLVNLIPAYPFDGGRACKALLQSLRPELETRHAVLLVGHLARFVSLALLIAAVVFRGQFAFDQSSGVPTWLALVMLSIFVFFITRVEEIQPTQELDVDDSLFGYDFSQGYTSLARSVEEEEVELDEDELERKSFVAGWLETWKQKQEERRVATEAEEDRRLDEILARLHKVGERGLSGEERGILKRVSARYRSREQQS